MASTRSKQQKLLKPLPKEIRSMVRSGISITTLSQCVEELVYNAVDAGARHLNISINAELFNVRVEDDGAGLSEADLESVGDRYTTSKCHCLEDLSKLKYYGFRGEALASIIEVSSYMELITRPIDKPGIELRKKYENGRVLGYVEKQNAPNKKPGTTVVVGKLLSKLPVRQRRIDKSLQIEEVKNSLERIVLTNPNLTVELRNEQSGSIIFSYKTSSSYSEAFDQLYRPRIGFEVNFVEENFRYKNLFFTLSVSKDYYKKKYYQYVFINSRFIQRCRIHRVVGSTVLEGQATAAGGSPKTEKFPIFILNINCPFSEYDITLEPKKQKVEFKEWDVMKEGIEGLIEKLKARHNFGSASNAGSGVTKTDKNVSGLTSYDMKSALHSRFVSRIGNCDTQGEANSCGSSSSEKSTTDGKRGRGKIVRNRTFNRTGVSSRVVDVKAVRRRKRASASLNSANVTLPKAVQPPVVKKKPRLTDQVFNQFPEWKEQLQDATQSSSRSHQVENMTREPIWQWRMARCTQSSQDDSIIDSATPHSSQPLEKCEESKREGGDKGVHVQPAQETTPLNPGSSDPIQVASATAEPQQVIRAGASDEAAPATLRSSQEVLDALYGTADKYMDDMIRNKWKLPDRRKEIVTSIFNASKENKQKVALQESLRNWAATACAQESDSQLLEEPARNSRGSANTADEVNSYRPPLLHPPTLQVLNLSQVAETLSCHYPLPPFPAAPPLLNVLPLQKAHSSEWRDEMMGGDYSDSDPDMFPSDWSVEIVSDSNNQEWLKTEDANGKTVYINMTNGDHSYDMVHVFGSLKKVAVADIKRSCPARFNWLRRHFPKGFRQFWNGRGREISRQGDTTKMTSNLLGSALEHCAPDSKEGIKWREGELPNLSEYFQINESSSSSSYQTVQNLEKTDIKCWKNMAGVMSSFRFSREDMEQVRVISQFDKKFIIAALKKSAGDNEKLVLFDQHAVHERIRLEKFTEESYVNSKSAKKYLVYMEVMPPYSINLSETEVRIMQNYEDQFEQIGIKFTAISSTAVKIKTAPKCFCEKAATETLASREAVLRSLIHNLIQEHIHHIIDTKGTSLTGLPKVVFDVLCSQACHGAIKFGDELDYDTCCQLISDLKKCKNLFQCAHGRPSVVPMSDLDSLKNLFEPTNFLPRHAPCQIDPCSTNQDHRNCSKYFCKPENTRKPENKSSGYFSILDNSSAPTGIFSDKCDTKLFSFNVKCDVMSQSTNMFGESSKYREPKIEDDEDSPYFLGTPM